MFNLGPQFSVDPGSVGAPGYSFNGLATSGIFGRPDGGFGASVFGIEMFRYEGTGRFFSKSQDFARVTDNIGYNGTLTWTGTNLTWTGRFRAQVPRSIVNAGAANFAAPATGTVIPIHGSATTRTVVAAGIPLSAEDMLFGVVADNGTISYIITVAGLAGNLTYPDNWVLIAARTTDNSNLRLVNGATIRPGYTFHSTAGWYRNTAGSMVLLGDAGTQNFQITSAGKYLYGSNTAVQGGDHNYQASASLSFVYHISSAAANEKYWQVVMNTKTWALNAMTDDFVGGAGVLLFTRSGTVVTQAQIAGTFLSLYDNLYALGSPAFRWSTAYFGTAPTVSSDRRYKEDIRDLEDAEIAAWASVGPKVYRLIGKPLQHSGYIAQEVEDAFADQGLDAHAYALIERGDDGYLHLRYGECAIFEAAYQRRRADKLEDSVRYLSIRLDRLIQALNLGGV